MEHGKKKKKKREREGGAGNERTSKRNKLGGHGTTSNLFIDSLSGGGGADGEADDSHTENYNGNPYGPGGDDYYNEGGQMNLKKNRPGQRARKAKAMAIQAKKEGRTWDSSVNWREKKKTKPEDENENGGNKQQTTTASGLKADTKIEAKDIAGMGKSWKEEGKAHPSWAARQTQKAKSGVGIVEFTGKKITF
uniref:Bud22 domain-containing protein n=1 Tax=Ditylum brightwellii TaxID=49249 RepID=A0A6V2HBK2_9STRA|mmetsp:Transcript_57890/g.85994  ORF Transcript_57890/g.85994 Transcript_57890/m.85994 type:complete len:193 (+) Transcript_57890:1-579(+)